jgi:hypothetical protein
MENRCPECGQVFDPANPTTYILPGELPRIPPGVWFWLLVVLVAYNAVSVGLIELDNWHTGWMLPRRPPAGFVGNFRWRISLSPTPTRWRESKARETGDDTWRTRALTSAEQADMDKTIRFGRARNALRGEIEELPGCTLWLTCPGALVGAAIVVVRHWHLAMPRRSAELGLLGLSAILFVLSVWHVFLTDTG